MFFFKQKTAYEMRISDWSSDVCSSDLITGNVNCGIQALLGPPTLFELEKPHQRLRAAEIEWLAVEPISILKSQIVQHHSWAFHHSAGMWHRNADRISSRRSSLVARNRRERRRGYSPISARSDEHPSELQSLVRISYAPYRPASARFSRAFPTRPYCSSSCCSWG